MWDAPRLNRIKARVASTILLVRPLLLLRPLFPLSTATAFSLRTSVNSSPKSILDRRDRFFFPLLSSSSETRIIRVAFFVKSVQEAGRKEQERTLTNSVLRLFESIVLEFRQLSLARKCLEGDGTSEFEERDVYGARIAIGEKHHLSITWADKKRDEERARGEIIARAGRRKRYGWGDGDWR